MGSFSFLQSIKVANDDIFELSADEIIEKYKVEGFWNKLAIKQDIKSRQDTKSLIHFVIGKLLWFTLMMIPLMSGLFMLLYRK